VRSLAASLAGALLLFAPGAGAVGFQSAMVPDPDDRPLAVGICVDPPGFDRAAFHLRFNREIVGFFGTQLHVR
jgi:hypothetical protein